MAFAVSTPTIEAATQPAIDLDAEFARLRGVDIGDSKKLAAAMVQVEQIKRRAHALSIDLLAASEAGACIIKMVTRRPR